MRKSMVGWLVVVVCLVAAGSAVAAPTPAPCHKVSTGRYDCTFYPAGDGIHAGTIVVGDTGYWVGYLNKGTNWVTCQAYGGEVRSGNSYNHWWGWTEANDGKWGWVNAVWVSGGANDGKFGTVRECDPQRDVGPPGQRSNGPAAPSKPKPTPTAPETVPCAKQSAGRYHCTFYPAGDGIHGGAVVVGDDGYWVGYLNRGDNWISCQAYGGEVKHGSSYNHWWGWTEANNHKWGWVNAVWASGGANDGKFGGVPECDPQRDAGPAAQKSSGPGQKPKPTPPKPKPAPCPTYEIFGLRGSGESYSGMYNMGGTVGLAAFYAVHALPAHSVTTLSVPYPAASVGKLISDPNVFFQSMDYGEFETVALVHRLDVRCPHVRVAIIGYSQGAGVASQSVRMMPASDRAHIAALVLFADVYSKGKSSYAFTFNPFQQDQRHVSRDGHGVFGGKSIPLPASHIADVCFNVDPVCVTGSAGTTITNAMFAGVHTEYKSWDGDGLAPSLLPLIFGHFAAQKLKG